MPSQTSSQGSDGGEEVGASPADAGRAAGADAPEPVSASRPVGSIPDAKQLSAHIGHLEDQLRDARDALFQIGLSHHTFVALLGGPTKTGTHVWRGQLGTASVNFALHAETRAREAVEAIEQLLAPSAKALGQHLGGEGL